MCVEMKRHGDGNEDKQPDKRPCPHQVNWHTTHVVFKITEQIHISIYPQVAQSQAGLAALPSDLARLLLSFLHGRSIPSLLGVSQSARQMCVCIYGLDLSRCDKLDDVRFLSSLVRLRILDLSGCSKQLVDVSPLSSLTSLTTLYLRNVYGHRPAGGRVAPLGSCGIRNLVFDWMCTVG